MHVLNTGLGLWEPLPSRMINGFVVGETTHFSSFGVFEAPDPEANTSAVKLYQKLLPR